MPDYTCDYSLAFGFEYWNLEFRDCLGFRIWNLGFIRYILQRFQLGDKQLVGGPVNFVGARKNHA